MEMRALPVSDTFHGFKAGDTVETQDGRIARVMYVGMETYTRDFGMGVEYQDGSFRFFCWNSLADVDQVKRMVKL
jgi:hypothetical protein